MTAKLEATRCFVLLKQPNANEWRGSCPTRGGNDRFRIFETRGIDNSGRFTTVPVFFAGYFGGQP